jgi:predicted nucleic acid-binding Zn ribbon protein
MKSADEVLQMLLQNSKSPLSNQFLRWRVWKDWKTLVGAQIASKCQPAGYHRRTLYIWVESSAWMQQLSFFSSQIKEKVNKHVGKQWVNSVRFTLDRKSVPTSEESAQDLKDNLSKTLPSEGGAPKNGPNSPKNR